MFGYNVVVSCGLLPIVSVFRNLTGTIDKQRQHSFCPLTLASINKFRLLAQGGSLYGRRMEQHQNGNQSVFVRQERTDSSRCRIPGQWRIRTSGEEHTGPITRGDAALLRFAAAAEIMETDFWVQCNDSGAFRTAKSGWKWKPSLHRCFGVLDSDIRGEGLPFSSQQGFPPNPPQRGVVPVRRR
jgi:hypothetical protein